MFYCSNFAMNLFIVDELDFVESLSLKDDLTVADFVPIVGLLLSIVLM